MPEEENFPQGVDIKAAIVIAASNIAYFAIRQWDQVRNESATPEQIAEKYIAIYRMVYEKIRPKTYTQPLANE